MGMGVEVSIAGSTAESGHYFTWAPVAGTIRVVDPDGATAPISVTLSDEDGEGGAVQFRTGPGSEVIDELQLDLDPAGAPVDFQTVPMFGSPSVNDGDVTIRVVSGGAVVYAATAMVRIRKDANGITTDERDRLLTAFAELNDSGAGVWQDFRDTHTDMSDPEAHGRAGFLCWHRAFLLDLERELQNVDPSIALPYWRFDEPAPNLFTPQFIGASSNALQTTLAPTNPLTSWVTDGQPGISRRARFNEQTSAASGQPGFPVLTELQTIQLGLDFIDFNDMEGTPHGAAHVSFNGHIRSIGSAVRDPLFFLLHCNVDRLWAKWQWIRDRFDRADPRAFPMAGVVQETDRVGHRVDDTMWPWNGIAAAPRPPTAPRTPLMSSPTTAAPGPQPTVGDMIDYQGQLNPTHWLAFGYDDVPYDGP
jgi:tyrosinase